MPTELGYARFDLEFFGSGLVLAELKVEKAAEDVELGMTLDPRMYTLTFHLHCGTPVPADR